MIALDRLDQYKAPYRGAAFYAVRAGKVIAWLLSEANQANESDTEEIREYGRNLLRIADAMKNARSEQGHLILLTPFADEATLREEPFHIWRYDFAGVFGLAVEDLGRNSLLDRARAALKADGYPDRDIVLSREITAKIAAGSADSLGLSEPEARKLMADFFRAMARMGGVESLRYLPAMAPGSIEWEKEVYEQHRAGQPRGEDEGWDAEDHGRGGAGRNVRGSAESGTEEGAGSEEESEDRLAARQPRLLKQLQSDFRARGLDILLPSGPALLFWTRSLSTRAARHRCQR